MVVTKADEACIKIIQKQLTERRTFGWDYANALALILLFNPNNVVRRPSSAAESQGRSRGPQQRQRRRRRPHFSRLSPPPLNCHLSSEGGKGGLKNAAKTVPDIGRGKKKSWNIYIHGSSDESDQIGEMKSNVARAAVAKLCIPVSSPRCG